MRKPRYRYNWREKRWQLITVFVDTYQDALNLCCDIDLGTEIVICSVNY